MKFSMGFFRKKFFRENYSAVAAESHPMDHGQWERVLLWIVAVIFLTSQYVISTMIPAGASISLKARLSRSVSALFHTQAAAARQILATKLNSDGKTTTVAPWPTITEVPAESKGMDPVEGAKVVMIATGAPFYAPDGISFDDAVGALAAWQSYEDTIQLDGELQKRWKAIIHTMTCDYCCGGPMQVTRIDNCGCAHSKAYRSIAKYLLKNHGDKYSNDEILGELQRWKGIWYPKGVVEDYLLATGRGDVLGHEPHGGSGTDGNHGF